jgi:hypothetical protein
MPSRTRITVAVVLAAGLGGCGSSDSPATGDFVGRAAGGKAFVAVVVGRARVVAFVCDGRHGVAELFTGARTGNRATLRNAHGAGLLATISGTRVTGAFKPARGGSLRFAAAPAPRPAGFYRTVGSGRGTSATIGWVVLADGSQRGAITIGSRVVNAPALNTRTSTARLGGAGRVRATRISSSHLSAVTHPR